jgi:general secretion pathway protein H
MPRRDDGFTLLEILIVLAIMGMVLAVVVSHGPIRSQGLDMRAAAGAIAQSFRAARAQAIERSETVSVVIDPQQHAFAADRGGIHTLAADLAVTLLPGTMAGPNETGIVRFSPDGSASGGGVRLGHGARQVQISVEWLTGRVRVGDAS